MQKASFLYIFTILLLTACTNAPDSDQAKTSEAEQTNAAKGDENWKIDVASSDIKWIGTKVSGYHTGEIPLKSGHISLSNGNVVGGNFVMDVANLTVSGPKGSNEAMNKKLLGHLQSEDFFDVQKHSEAIFELTDVQPFQGTVQDTTDPRQEEINQYKVTNPTHTVRGNLTIKGITKNIEFPAQITTSGNTVDAIAKFNINRKDWNIVYAGQPDDLIRDDVHLGIAIKANK
jgi:polyisoprenoid-binding protein YceI